VVTSTKKRREKARYRRRSGRERTVPADPGLAAKKVKQDGERFTKAPVESSEKT